jgi:hypothetical protein
VCTTCFWSNLHQVRSKSEDWKAKSVLRSFILLDFGFWWTLKFANISSPSVLVIVISQYLIWSSFLHCCIHIVVIKEKLFNIQWTILFYWSQNWFSFPIFRFWAYRCNQKFAALCNEQQLTTCWDSSMMGRSCVNAFYAPSVLLLAWRLEKFFQPIHRLIYILLLGLSINIE